MEQKRLPIFAERFAELRGVMTQGAFANFLGISRPTVGFYENGSRLPDALVLRQIAVACNVSSDWLIGLTDVRSADGDLKQACNYTKLSEGAIKRIHELYRIEKFLENDCAVNMADILSMVIEQACFEPMIQDLQYYFDSLYHFALNDGTYGTSLDESGAAELLDALREKCGKHLHILLQCEVPNYYKNSVKTYWEMLLNESEEDYIESVRKRHNIVPPQW